MSDPRPIIGWLLDPDQRRELLQQFPPRYAHVVEMTDLGEHWAKEIETFFETYKWLEPGQTEVLGWHTAAEAWDVIAEARRHYAAVRARPTAG